MKQITMDFETYEAELLEERQAGAQISERLIEEIENAFRTWHSMDKNKWDDAMYHLNISLNQLKQIDFKKESK